MLYTALALFLVYMGLPMLYPFGSDKRDFFAAYDAKWTAQSRIGSPRILLVGGSSWLFGVDSRRLQQAVGLPVYDLGLQIGLGLPYFLSVAEAAARPGDILLFTPEYRCREGELRTLALLQLQSPRMAEILETSLADRVRLATQRAQVSASGLINTWLLQEYAHTDIYRADAFDAWGDLRPSRNLPKEDYPIPPPLDTSFVPFRTALSITFRKLENRGVHCLFVPQPYPVKGFHQDSAAIGYLMGAVKGSGWPLLCPPDSMVYADSLFFDSPNHLREQGRQLRTVYLTALLKTYIQGNQTLASSWSAGSASAR